MVTFGGWFSVESQLQIHDIMIYEDNWVNFYQLQNTKFGTSDLLLLHETYKYAWF